MARTFNFAVLRLSPDEARGEAVNLGIVVFDDDGVDVRLGEVLTRARLLYPELSSSVLQENIAIIKRLGAANLPALERHRGLSRLGAFALGELGYFTVQDRMGPDYEAQVSRLLKMFVVVPRSSERARHASRLVTTVRKAFRREKVLAAIGDASAISEHKIVPEWPLPTQSSLKADLALKNGFMRVCEIVEIVGEENGPLPSGIFEGVVTLDAAQRDADAKERVFAYRPSASKARVDQALNIAALHATKFVNWDSTVERESFLHDWITAARKGIEAVQQKTELHN